MDVDRAAHGIDRACEFDEKAVADVFDNATAMFGDLGGEELTIVRIEPRQRALFVYAHQSAVADYIASKNRCQPALAPLVRHALLKASL